MLFIRVDAHPRRDLDKGDLLVYPEKGSSYLLNLTQGKLIKYDHLVSANSAFERFEI